MKVVNVALQAENLQEIKNRFSTKHAVAGDCWEWTASLDPSGYGMFSVGAKVDRAHRFAYAFENGPIPMRTATRSMCVCHSCDNRKCVNPKHLFLGTDEDNAKDMKKKGRASRGNNHHSTTINEESVKQIRRDPRRASIVAHQHGISTSNVHAIRAYHTWAHVEPELVGKLERARREAEELEPRVGVKLTEEQAVSIRSDARHSSVLADEYRVTRGAIEDIKASRTWGYLQSPIARAARKDAISGSERKHKLTDDQVRAIRAARGTLNAVATVHGVSVATVSNLKNYEAYAWVAPTPNDVPVKRHKKRRGIADPA